MFAPEDLQRQVETALAYLRGRFLKLKRGEWNPGYFLKHRAERDGDDYLGYVAEGAVLLAAMIDGLEHRPALSRPGASIFR